jgi:hypothetical protein
MTATATAPTRRGVWTPAAAIEAIENRDPYAHLTGPDGAAPATCPPPVHDPYGSPPIPARCPSCGAVPGVDRINPGTHPETVHPGKGKPCPLPTAPRDRYPGESLARYLAFVEGWYGLRRHLRPGDTVSLVLRHRSTSGMLRRISPILADRDGYTLNLDRYAAMLYDAPPADAGEGVKVGGCGMDMGFHLVYELSHALYGNGYALRHRWL